MKRIPFLVLAIILFIHVFIITKLIYFPYPELFIYPYLTNHGLKPYSQILDQHFPGPMFLPINLDNLGMNTPEVARFWSISIVVVIHLMLFFVSSQIFKSKFKALLVNMLFLLWQPFFEGWVLWIDNFLPLLLLPAFYALFKGSQGNRWVLICGLFLGLGIVFKQTIIPLSVLVFIYLFWTTQNIKTVLIYSLGIFIPVSLMLLYIISIGVWRDFWFWTVVFNLTTYAEFGLKTPPSLGFITRILLVYGTGLLCLLKGDKKVRLIILIFTIGSLVGAFERADFVHFQPSLPFAILATVYGLGALGKLGRLGFLSVYGIILVWWIIIFYKGHIGDRVISFDLGTTNLVAKVRNYTKEGEKIFVYGAAPHLYQMTKTLPAGDEFVFPFPWFLQVSESRILEGIKRDKPKIIVSDRSVTIEGAKITDFASDIDRYISEHYQKIDSVGSTDILRRKD